MLNINSLNYRLQGTVKLSTKFNDCITIRYSSFVYGLILHTHNPEISGFSSAYINTKPNNNQQ